MTEHLITEDTMATEAGTPAESTAAATAGDPAGTPPAVVLRGVGKTFNAGRSGEVTALQDVDLTIAPGEFVSLIGPSGCGKSTLMRIVADLETPTSGNVEVFGKTPHAARVDQDYGIAFQHAGLLPWRTVLSNVELPLELHGRSRVSRQSRARELLDLVGLRDFYRHRPDQLSGGMQQRVAIARALAEEPKLLLMDEPFGALDEMTRERMQAELVSLCAKTGCAVIFVTHSIPEAVYLSDRVVVMSARPGRIGAIVPIHLSERNEDLREDAGFFERVTAVREALRGHEVPAPPRGADLR